MTRVLPIAFVLAVAVAGASASAPPPGLPPAGPPTIVTTGAVVTIVAPANALTLAGHLFGEPTPILTATIAALAGGDPTISGHDAWRTEGLPLALVAHVHGTITRGDVVEVEYRSEPNQDPYSLKFDVPRGADAASLLAPFVVLGTRDAPAARAAIDLSYRALAPVVFVNAPGVPDDARLPILRAVGAVPRPGRVWVEGFEGQRYLGVESGPPPVPYDDKAVTEIQRVGAVLAGPLLDALAALGAALPADGLDGVAVHTGAAHRDPAKGLTAAPAFEQIDLFAPLDVVRRFGRHALTRQQFVDGCLIRADGGPITVALPPT